MSSASDPQPVEIFEHWCESCGRTEMLTPTEAFNTGWDFPPYMGEFGVVTPRTCPRCPITSTVWWAVAVEGCPLNSLDRRQLAVIVRILAERGVPDATA